MRTVLRLIQGDKRNPTRVFDFHETGAVVSLAPGLNPTAGAETIQWSGYGPTGRRRVTSRRESAEFELVYHVWDAGSTADVGWLQREVERFFHDAGLYEEGEEGEPVWLEYRWPDGLETLPAPAFGQFSYYMRVLAGRQARPADLHEWLQCGVTRGVIASVTCRPWWEGAQQIAGKGVGQLEIDNKGLLIPGGLTNLCTNPSFGHATWNTGWAVSTADLKATNETRRDFTRSLRSAAHLVNLSAAAATFRQTLTLTAVDHFISCYVRRQDGEAVTSADMVMLGQGAALDTTFVRIDGGPWYLAYGLYTAAAVASTHGVQVAVGREVIVDDVQIAVASSYTVPRPFCGGWMPTCAWSGTAHASNSARGAPNLLWTLSDELNGEYSIGGWIVPFWSNAGPGLDLFVCEYYVDGDNFVQVYYDFTADRFEVAGERDGTAFSGNGSGRTFSMFTPIHLMLVQDTTTLKLYVNGAQDISVNTAVGQPTGGTLYLGNSQAGGQIINAYVDGWRIWKLALSATQVDALYDAELPVKNEYGSVGLPYYLYTKDGDNGIDNANDTNRDNWCIVGGVGGDLPAAVRWEIYPPTESPERVYWLGRKATVEQFDPSLLYAEFSGTASASSGGEHYDEAAGTGDVYETYTPTGIARYMRWMAGRYQYLGRLRANTQSLVAKAVYDFGTGAASSRIFGDAVSIASSASMLWRDFGDLTLRIPDGGQAVTSLNYRLYLDRTASTAVQLDFFMLMPHPMVRASALGASITITAGECVVIEEGRAFTLSSGGAVHDFFEARGEDVTLEPNQYNTVFLMQAEEGVALTLTLTATLQAKITPRFTLPGGLIA